MDNELKFRTAAMGYNKNDVNNYIDQLTQEYQNKVKEKDDELARLRNQNKELKTQIEEVLKKENENADGKSKIAEVLLKAQETADSIMEEARKNALEEKRKIEEDIEQDREKLVDLKSEIKKLKSNVTETLKLFQSELDSYIKEENN